MDFDDFVLQDVVLNVENVLRRPPHHFCPVHFYTDREFYERFRVSKAVVNVLSQKLNAYLVYESERNMPLTPTQQFWYSYVSS